VGAIFSGVNIALFNTALEMTPEKQKTSYLAYFNTAVTISSIIAPLLGVSLLQLMSFRAAFLVTAGVRMAGSLCYFALYRVERREGRLPKQEVRST
jgi:predicted MFS family arabinose efflux permease